MAGVTKDPAVSENTRVKPTAIPGRLSGRVIRWKTRQAGMPSFQVANLIRDRQLLEAAKREAAAVLAGPTEEIPKEEIDRALRHMRAHWQKTYGLVEVG